MVHGTTIPKRRDSKRNQNVVMTIDFKRVTNDYVLVLLPANRGILNLETEAGVFPAETHSTKKNEKN